MLKVSFDIENLICGNFLDAKEGFEHNSMKTVTVRITKLNLENRISN